MADEQHLYSKVLVQEHDPEALEQLKCFCEENHLIGLRDRSEDILEIIQDNLNLGAIFLAMPPNADTEAALAIARVINHYQHAVPVFLRVPEDFDSSELPDELNQLIAGTYRLSELEKLKDLVLSHVFCMHYPTTLVQGFEEVTEKALLSAFKNAELSKGTPCVLKDNTIYGEILSLIELESSWCRGYMMIQTDKPGILSAIKKERTALPPQDADVRGIDTMISELTNLIWGGIKARFFTENKQEHTLYRIQIPVVVNHTDKYVTFGSDKPQLCLEYQLRDKDNQEFIITIFQRFIFNIEWSPELFSESENTINEMVDTGELELF